eukprot:UN14618
MACYLKRSCAALYRLFGLTFQAYLFVTHFSFLSSIGFHKIESEDFVPLSTSVRCMT